MARTIADIMDTDPNPAATVGASDDIARMAVEASEGDIARMAVEAGESGASGSAQPGGGAESGRRPPFRLPAMGRNLSDRERLASLIGGGALAAYGLRRGSKLGYTLAAAGLGLAARGATGRCPVCGAARKTAAGSGASTAVEVKESITVGKPPEEIYRFWRNLENLPKFMDHLESVAVRDGKVSYWVAKAPLGRTVSWYAEITADEPGTYIAWRSLPGSQIVNSGMVSFREAPAGRGAEVHVHLTYEPPAGQIGRAVATLAGEEPRIQVHNDLLRLKRLLETGEIPTIEGQPHGERSLKGRLLNTKEG